MKAQNLFSLFALIFSLSSLGYAQSNQLICTYYPGGYDVETITVQLKNKNEVASIQYDSYMGEVGPFVKLTHNTFLYSNPNMILNEIIFVSVESKAVILTTVYKDSGTVLNSNTFKCE